MVYTSIKELLKSFLDELMCTLKEYAEKQEAALKLRLKKILILTITGVALLALAVTMAGTATLFFLIGSLRYLQTFLPAWQAWLVMAASSAIVAVSLFVALYFIIRRRLATPQSKQQ